MSRFKNIDIKIKKVANQLNAKLSIDRPTYPEPLRTFEERRIDWEEDGLNKAIIIQPSFGSTEVDSTKWSFINLAWNKRNGIDQKPGWKVKLIDGKEFKAIEKNINDLLDKSIHNLKSVKYTEVEKLIRKR